CATAPFPRRQRPCFTPTQTSTSPLFSSSSLSTHSPFDALCVCMFVCVCVCVCVCMFVCVCVEAEDSCSEQRRSHSPVPSGVSMKSDQSMNLPLRLAEGGVPAGQR